MPDAAQAQGWTLRYVQGDDPEHNPGHLLCTWKVKEGEREFAFSPDIKIVRTFETEALKIRDLLRTHMKVETEVIKV
jgi:hypothetical protein